MMTMPGQIRFAAVLCGIYLAMYATIVLSYSIGFATHFIVAVWPAAAIAYWAARRYGAWAVLPVFLADATNALLWLDIPPFVLFTSLGNALAAYIGTKVERHFSQHKNPFATPRAAMAFLFGGFGTLCIISTVIGTTVIAYHFMLTPQEFLPLAWRWLLSDITGLLVFCPLLVLAGPPYAYGPLTKTILYEAAITSIALALVFLSIRCGLSPQFGQYPTVLITLPAILLLAFSPNSARSALAFTVIALGSLILTLHSVGNLADSAWLSVQLYLTLVIGCGYVLHAVNMDRTRLVNALAKEKQKLEERIADRTSELETEVRHKTRIADRLEKLATIDPLTNAFNRRFFFTQAKVELLRASSTAPLSIIVLDLDHFKEINDRYGHATGDEVLIHLVRQLRSGLRDKDTLARLGGEEFAILLPETSLEKAIATGERLRERIERDSVQPCLLTTGRNHLDNSAAGADMQQHQTLPPNAPGNGGIRFTASFGVVQCSFGSSDITHALNEADKALYHAKESGRNRVKSAGIVLSITQAL